MVTGAGERRKEGPLFGKHPQPTSLEMSSDATWQRGEGRALRGAPAPRAPGSQASSHLIQVHRGQVCSSLALRFLAFSTRQASIFYFFSLGFQELEGARLGLDACLGTVHHDHARVGAGAGTVGGSVVLFAGLVCTEQNSS